MRDSTISQMHNAQAQNVAHLYQSLIAMDARAIALEKSLFEKAGLWIALFFPAKFRDRFERIHKETLNAHAELMKETAKQIDAERKKPKIELVTP